MSKLSVLSENAAKTMSSREISELTGKRHDHVYYDITKMLNELGAHAPDYAGTYNTTQGNTYPLYNLPRRECDILISGYSIKYRAAIVDRWQELEGAPVQLNDHTVAAYLAEREKYVLMIEAEAARIRSTLFPLVSELNPSVIAIEQDLQSQRIEQVKEVIARRKERGATRITLTQLRDGVKNLKVFTGQKKLITYLKNEVIPELVTGGQITVYDKLLYLN